MKRLKSIYRQNLQFYLVGFQINSKYYYLVVGKHCGLNLFNWYVGTHRWLKHLSPLHNGLHTLPPDKTPNMTAARKIFDLITHTKQHSTHRQRKSILHKTQLCTTVRKVIPTKKRLETDTNLVHKSDIDMQIYLMHLESNVRYSNEPPFLCGRAILTLRRITLLLFYSNQLFPASVRRSIDKNFF